MKKAQGLSQRERGIFLVVGWLVFSGAQCRSGGTGGAGPDAVFEKPKPITMAELAGKPIEGVAVFEVTDYAPGHYAGEIPNAPPHADRNPRRSFIIKWRNHSQIFVFNHEGSYCPWLELPNGVALCNQFFEGNEGWAELFNQNGRKEKNSFVDVIRSGPSQAWVRWTYQCVHKDSDSLPALRGTEDYIAYPNGLVWRRLKYESLMPEASIGYSWQPIDFFSIAPAGTRWKDLFPEDDKNNDYHVAAVLDVYSGKRYDKFWDDEGKARRVGSDELLLEISRSEGLALVSTTREGYQYVLIGRSSGFLPEKSQIVDHSFNSTGGWGWNSSRWDHWPIGWLNSQAHTVDAASRYPYHFGPFSHYFVGQPVKDANTDYWAYCKDMELNKWTESRVFYTLTGVAEDYETIRAIGRRWLDKGARCASPDSVTDLQ